MKNVSNSHQRLRSYLDRIVRLEEEKAQLADDIKDIYCDAKGEGFDPKPLRNAVKRAMMTESERLNAQELEAITDVYLATLGLLAGSPLDDAARRRADDSRNKPAEEAKESEPTAESPPHDPQTGEVLDEAPAPAPEPPPETNEQARGRGMQAAADGQSVFKNPYIAGDPRRAYWDEGWCEVAGSDGMDVPEAWRRKSVKKPDEAK